jgi:uncharacterized protein YbdZ (MbtH family)
MADHTEDDATIYKVVMNHEEQYSIWPARRQNPNGWKDAGPSGSKEQCLAYIREVWTDMRPLSLRKKMEERAAAPELEATNGMAGTNGAEKDDLVSRLAAQNQAVEIVVRPPGDVKAFQSRLEQGYVHVSFPATRGGTQLGVNVDKSALRMTNADFEQRKGIVHLEGGLTLNYQKVRVIADINLETLTGEGKLHLMEQQDRQAS